MSASLVELGDPGEHVGVEVAADDRGQRQRTVCRRAQARDPPADHLADADRQARRPQVRARDPAAVLVLVDGPRLGQVPEHLTDEERVAVGLGQQRVAQRDALLGHLVAGRRLEQGEELVVAEAAQREPLDARLPVQRRERLGERVIGADVGVAERPDHEQPKRRVRRHDVTQELDRRAVRPVQVVEHEHDRRHRRDARQQVDDRTEQQIPLRLGVARRGVADRRARRASSGASRASSLPRASTCAASTSSGA